MCDKKCYSNDYSDCSSELCQLGGEGGASKHISLVLTTNFCYPGIGILNPLQLQSWWLYITTGATVLLLKRCNALQTEPCMYMHHYNIQPVKVNVWHSHLIYGKTLSCMTLMMNRLPEKKRRMDMSLSFENSNYTLFAPHNSLFLLFHAITMEPLNVIQWISKSYT